MRINRNIIIFLLITPLILLYIGCKEEKKVSKSATITKEAYVDIGSGSTKLIIVTYEKLKNGKKVKIEVIKREPILFKKNLTKDKKFPKELEKKLEKVLKEYYNIAKKINAEIIGAGATSAFRKADKKYIQDLIERITKDTNWKIKVLKPEEEAKSAYCAIKLLYPNVKDFIGIDMGGGSIQLMREKDGKFQTISLEWGAVPVTKFLKSKFPEKRPDFSIVLATFKEELKKNKNLKEWLNLSKDTKVIVIGGVAFGLSKILKKNEINKDDLIKLEEKIRNLSKEQVEKLYPSAKPYGAEIWPNTIAFLTWMDLLNKDTWKVEKIEMGAGLKSLDYFKKK